MLNFLTANISPDGLRDHNAEKSHVLKPYGIVAQLRNRLIQDVRNPDENPDDLNNSPKEEQRAYKDGKLSRFCHSRA